MQSKTNQLNNLLGSGTDRGAGTIGGGLGSSSLSQNPLIPQYNSSLSQGVFEVFVDVFDAYCLGVLISKSCFIHPTILLVLFESKLPTKVLEIVLFTNLTS